MKSLKAVAFISLSLTFLACSTTPPVPLSEPIPARQHERAPAGRAQSGQPPSAPVPQLSEAPSGFDNASNGLVDAKTHQSDQAQFESLETIASGLGPLYNARSCGDCHQSTVTGGSSQLTELRVGHKGPNGQFQ